MSSSEKYKSLRSTRLCITYKKGIKRVRVLLSRGWLPDFVSSLLIWIYPSKNCKKIATIDTRTLNKRILSRVRRGLHLFTPSLPREELPDTCSDGRWVESWRRLTDTNTFGRSRLHLEQNANKSKIALSTTSYLHFVNDTIAIVIPTVKCRLIGWLNVDTRFRVLDLTGVQARLGSSVYYSLAFVFEQKIGNFWHEIEIKRWNLLMSQYCV